MWLLLTYARKSHLCEGCLMCVIISEDGSGKLEDCDNR